jgi:hypothetical protein
MKEDLEELLAKIEAGYELTAEDVQLIINALIELLTPEPLV